MKGILERIPNNLWRFVNSIDIIDSDQFISRNISALYANDVIYVSPSQSNEEDMANDIVHELAHSIEEHIEIPIQLKQEFLNKRKLLFQRISKADHTLSPGLFKDIKYNKSLDKLFLDMGSEMFEYTSGIFNSVYSATSLSEYFAEGFQFYFTSDTHREFMKYNCKELYLFLEQLINKLS